jgi:hypothetical protein
MRAITEMTMPVIVQPAITPGLDQPEPFEPFDANDEVVEGVGCAVVEEEEPGNVVGVEVELNTCGVDEMEVPSPSLTWIG